MIRKNYYLREDQIKALAELQGNDSEHLRAALDEYLKRKFNVSTSPTK